MSFDQASRLEAKLDLLLNSRSNSHLEKKMDIVLAAIDKTAEADDYWALGGERRKQKEKAVAQQKKDQQARAHQGLPHHNSGGAGKQQVPQVKK